VGAMSAGNRGDGVSNCGHNLFLLVLLFFIESYRFNL
jgi:hypothetical protein